MKVTFARAKCEGYGKCVEVAPKVCPTKAIIVQEDEGGRQIFS